MLVGIIIGLLIYRVMTRPKNQVMYCRERDGRGLELDIGKEDHATFESNTDPPLRFWKYGRAYNFLKRGRTYARYFAKEGSGYSWRLQGFEKKQGKLVQVEIPFPTLEAAVQSVWGEAFYATVPEERQAALRDNAMLVTVNLEPGITPDGYKPITEQTIRKKNREDAKDLIARGLKGAVKDPIMKTLMYLGCGAGIGWIANFLLTGV